MMIQFRTPIGPDEEGYRNRQLLIYGPMNYVGVYVRDTYDVIPKADLEYDEEADEELPKKGCGYVKGASAWVCIGYHDSGWHDCVERFLIQNEAQINGFSGSGWYQKINVSKFDLENA